MSDQPKEEMIRLLQSNIVAGSKVEQSKNNIPNHVNNYTDFQVEFCLQLDKIISDKFTIIRKTRFNQGTAMDYFIRDGKKFFAWNLRKDGNITLYFCKNPHDSKNLFPKVQKSNETRSGVIFPNISQCNYILELAQRSYEKCS
ncbi:MAG: hypothetical protein ABIF87_04800 [Pseudomonadota bacterium]